MTNNINNNYKDNYDKKSIATNNIKDMLISINEMTLRIKKNNGGNVVIL